MFDSLLKRMQEAFVVVSEQDDAPVDDNGEYVLVKQLKTEEDVLEELIQTGWNSIAEFEADTKSSISTLLDKWVFVEQGDSIFPTELEIDNIKNITVFRIFNAEANFDSFPAVGRDDKMYASAYYA